MKIIASTGHEKFLVEATADELAQVMGHSWGSTIKDRLTIGADVKITRLYQALQVERTRQDRVTKLANDLRQVAKEVDTINAALDCPIIDTP